MRPLFSNEGDNVTAMNKGLLQGHSMKMNKFVVFLCEVLCITAVVMGISIMKDGMYLLGVPSINDVRKVVIAYPNVTDEVKEITDDGEIELAVKLTGFLKYSLFDKADASETPLISITYYLNNGESVSVAANKNTVWWKGMFMQ